ncbi:MAG: LysM peptidoglycan-binding domain-containing protein [candidate division Zixibacteria bacterium]|nr:LysM peptidoglycan-binding domain-containing protein [candidate division Zixibacteria bacterium]
MNISKNRYLEALLALGLVIVFALSGCSRPPIAVEEKSGAQKSSPSTEDPRTFGDSSVEPNDADTSWVIVALDGKKTQAVEVYDSDEFDLDRSVAVDDDIWRQLDLAGEYYSMGLVANQEGAWDEGQYYFERALTILGSLDVTPEGDSPTPESRRYNNLIENIVAAYHVTLLSLGKLPADISPSALIEKFGGLENILIDTTEISPVPIDTVITYDMPIKFNDRVRASIRYFQTDARDAFLRYYSRSTKYLPMIKEIIRSYGLPEDLCYLPLVESGYNANAYSWARAVGLWQFISSTGRMYGLNRSWWYDERRDPVKATHSACRFFKDLYREFGDWELALAAYNGGPGKVRRTIKRDKTRNFWKLRHLRRETRNYVPLYMAATIILKNPRKYGFEPALVDFEAPLDYEVVTVKKCLEFKTIAASVGVSVKEISDLNPELLRKHTPPDAKSYKLKIPRKTKDRFWAAYPSMESPRETSWVRHKIRKGQTVSTIAAKYGVSQYAIRQANNLRSSRIYAGKILVVPVPLDGKASARPTTKRKSKNGVYVVRRGDTVYDIARAFAVTMSSVKSLNNLGSRSRIYVGQRLRISGKATSAPTYATMKRKKGSTAKNTASKNASSKNTKFVSHRVRRGENLTVIARNYGVTVTELRQWNNLSRSSILHPSQTLRIGSSGQISSGSSRTYKVRRGDSLWKIARRYGVSVSDLRSWNNLRSGSKLRIGQTLKLGSARFSGGRWKWHTVRRGENLTAIAMRYRTTIDRIARDNNIYNPSSIKVGDRLKIQGS